MKQITLIDAFTWKDRMGKLLAETDMTSKWLIWYEELSISYSMEDRLAKVYGLGRRRSPNAAIAYEKRRDEFLKRKAEEVRETVREDLECDKK